MFVGTSRRFSVSGQGGQEGDVSLNLVNPPERVGTFV